MKVNGTRPEAQVARPSTPEVQQAGTGTAKRVDAVRPVSSERVDVSPLGKKLATVHAPEVPDEARILELRDKLASGRLEIDFEKIADAILREER